MLSVLIGQASVFVSCETATMIADDKKGSPITLYLL